MAINLKKRINLAIQDYAKAEKIFNDANEKYMIYLWRIDPDGFGNLNPDELRNLPKEEREILISKMPTGDDTTGEEADKLWHNLLGSQMQLEVEFEKMVDNIRKFAPDYAEKLIAEHNPLNALALKRLRVDYDKALKEYRDLLNRMLLMRQEYNPKVFSIYTPEKVESLVNEEYDEFISKMKEADDQKDEAFIKFNSQTVDAEEKADVEWNKYIEKVKEFDLEFAEALNEHRHLKGVNGN